MYFLSEFLLYFKHLQFQAKLYQETKVRVWLEVLNCDALITTCLAMAVGHREYRTPALHSQSRILFHFYLSVGFNL